MTNHYAVLWDYTPRGTSAYTDLTLEQAREMMLDLAPGYLPPGKTGIVRSYIIDQNSMTVIEEAKEQR